eukprot:jgi/Chlat1/1844/Chrsp14S02231
MTRHAQPASSMAWRRGSIVEVFANEEGFYGSWATAKVQSIFPGAIQVEYRDFLSDADPANKLVGMVQLCKPTAAQVGALVRPNTLPVRPKREPERERVATLDVEVGSWVEYLWRDVWWEAIVLRAPRHADDTALLFFATGIGDVLESPLNLLRPGRQWVDNKWVQAPRVEGSEFRNRCSLCNIVAGEYPGVLNEVDLAGPFYLPESNRLIWLHDECILYSTYSRQPVHQLIRGDVDALEIGTLLRRVERVECTYCHRQSASVKCAGRGCNAIYHWPCAWNDPDCAIETNVNTVACSRHQSLIQHKDKVSKPATPKKKLAKRPCPQEVRARTEVSAQKKRKHETEEAAKRSPSPGNSAQRVTRSMVESIAIDCEHDLELPDMDTRVVSHAAAQSSIRLATEELADVNNVTKCFSFDDSDDDAKVKSSTPQKSSPSSDSFRWDEQLLLTAAHSLKLLQCQLLLPALVQLCHLYEPCREKACKLGNPTIPVLACITAQMYELNMPHCKAATLCGVSLAEFEVEYKRVSDKLRDGL